MIYCILLEQLLETNLAPFFNIFYFTFNKKNMFNEAGNRPRLVAKDLIHMATATSKTWREGDLVIASDGVSAGLNFCFSWVKG